MKKKQLFINIFSNIISFAIQMGISFLLTPIIVGKVGDAAYGFIGLANNFVSYANIFAVAINSMASRFVTYELNKGNEKGANKYFTSVLVMDIILSLIILIFLVGFIANLEKLLEIPTELTGDVKITFTLAFLNLIITLLSTVFTISTFAKNRLDLDAYRNIASNTVKAIFLIIVFSILVPKIYYISISSLIYSVIIFIVSIYITKKISPELKVNFKNFDLKYIKTILKSGIWNTINNLSKTLLTGLDLLITNVFIGSSEMGILSIAKTIPTAIETLLATITNAFVPNFIMLYSQNKIRELVKNVNFSIKVVSLLMLVPIAGIVIFGQEFFKLWLPYKSNEEIIQIQILSVLSLLPYIISSNAYALTSLDTVTNKLRRPVIATFIMSIASTITTLVLLKTTNLGIYAVAGVSSIYWCLKVFIFNTINAAKNLRIKRTTFYPVLLRSTFSFGVVAILYYVIRKFISINSWMQLILLAIIVGMIGYVVVFLILLNNDEKKQVKSIIKRKFLREKNA